MTSQQPTPEAVEAVTAILRKCREVDAPVSIFRPGSPLDGHQTHIAWVVLTELRDAIHRGGPDAEPMREALGLSAETVMGARWVDDGPCNQTCGFVVCGPDHRRQRIQWADRRRVVGEWQEAQP